MLQDLVEKIKEKTAETKVDISAINPNVQSAAEGFVRAATDELTKLAVEYKKEVMQNLLIQAASGPHSAQFASIAAKGKILTVNYHGVIDRFVNNLKLRHARYEFDTQEYWMLMDEILKLKNELGASQMTIPANTRAGTVFMKPLKEAVKNLIELTYGQSLYSVVTRHDIANAAFDTLFTGAVLPVIIYNCDGEVDQTFLPKPFAVITVPETVNTKFVADTINQVKKQYKAINEPRKDETNE